LDPTLTEIAEDEDPTSITQVTVACEDDTILDTDIPNLGAIGSKNLPSEYQFTFSPPTIAASSTPVSDRAESVPPNALKDALTDPRLKLFQLNYDTYTREHLSAIVDSIPITPSRSGSTDGEVRNPKRIRLTPSSEIDEEDGFPPLQVRRRDYVGESKSLMSAICKNTRSVSLELSETEKSRVTATTRKVSSC
jgi:protein NUD1